MTTKKLQTANTNDVSDRSQQNSLQDCERVGALDIRRNGESVVLAPHPADWSGFFASGLTASADFMKESERMPIQERTH